MNNTSASADGKRLVFTKSSGQVSPYVAELESSGTRLSNPRPLANSQETEAPTRWTADSKAVLVDSNRNGPYSIFKTPVDESGACAAGGVGQIRWLHLHQSGRRLGNLRSCLK
jgi:hypothetical protein